MVSNKSSRVRAGRKEITGFGKRLGTRAGSSMEKDSCPKALFQSLPTPARRRRNATRTPSGFRDHLHARERHEKGLFSQSAPSDGYRPSARLRDEADGVTQSYPGRLPALGTSLCDFRRRIVKEPLRIRKRSVAGHEFARLHTGASITGKNSGNGALPTSTTVQMML